MSLIDELRNQDNHIDVSLPYEPLFLKYVRLRGYFLMSSAGLWDEEMDCLRKTKKPFKDWLKENKLKITKANIKDHYKIYY